MHVMHVMHVMPAMPVMPVMPAIPIMPLLPVAVLAALCHIAPPDAAPPSPKIEVSSSLAALAAADEARVTIEVHDASAESIIAKLNESRTVPVRADWPALERIGIDRTDKLDLVVRGVSLFDALSTLAYSLGRESERPIVDAAPGQLVLTTWTTAARMQELAIYDVADILTDSTLMLTVADTPATVQPTAVTATDETLEERTSRLIDLIQEHVDPDGWNTNGGDRGTISTEAARLVVSATPVMHRKIRRLLTQVRSESPLAAEVSVTLIELPRASLDALTRDAQALSARGEPSDLAAALAQKSDARRAWSPRVVARIGETAIVRSEAATEKGVCKIVARHDRIGHVLAVTIAVEVERGGRTASFEGVLPFARGQTPIATILPGGPTDSDAWVLVVGAAEVTRR